MNPARAGTFEAVVEFRGRVVHRDCSIPSLDRAIVAAAEDARSPQSWNLAREGEIAAGSASVARPAPIGRPTLRPV